MRTFIAHLLILAVVVLVSGGGCGRSGPPRGDVSGTVTYGGTPVEEGSITFYDPQSGKGAQAAIGPGGTYHVETQDGGLPLGRYRIFIMPPLIVDPGDGHSPAVKEPKDVANIPQKYRSEQTSGRELTVHEGENTYNVDMQDTR